MCMCLGKCTEVHMSWETQKRVLDPLELELQKIVSRHIGAKNQTQVLCKSSRCFDH